MKQMLRAGRRIWYRVQYENQKFFDGPVLITGFKQLLHAGPTERGERKKTLVQVFTDPGGLRTLAVADIWSKDPGKSDDPW